MSPDPTSIDGLQIASSKACRGQREHVDAGPHPMPGPSSAPVASTTPAPIDAGPPRTEPFVAKSHCAALSVVADAAIMSNAPSTALPTPPGFASCGWASTPGDTPSLNYHRWYRCRSASLEALEPGFYASVSAAWRGCLRKPDWQSAATVRYPNGTTSQHAANPDAYISKRWLRGSAAGP